jgi:hypothetical protein
MLTIIDSNPHFMNKDKCFRKVEEFIPLLSPCGLISFGPQVMYFFWSRAPGQIPKYNTVMTDSTALLSSHGKDECITDIYL